MFVYHTCFVTYIQRWWRPEFLCQASAGVAVCHVLRAADLHHLQGPLQMPFHSA